MDIQVSPAGMDRRIEKPRWRKYAPAGAAAGALLFALILWLAFAPPPGSRVVAAKDLTISTVAEAPFQDFVPARAEVAPLRTVFLDAVAGGRVERVVAEDGDVVKAGDLLAVLSNPDLVREVAQREADISGAVGDARGQLLQVERSRADRSRELEQARFEQLQADRQLDVQKHLHEKQLIAERALLTAQEEAEYRRARVRSLESSVRAEDRSIDVQAAEIRRTIAQLQSALAAVKKTLAALEVRAPVAGRLTAFDLQPGQTVQQGQRIGQIDSEAEQKLIAELDEFYLGRVSEGQIADVSVAGEDRRVTVSRILPQVQNGRFRVEFEFEGETPKDLRRGQTLDLRLTLGDTLPALVAPNGPFLQASGGAWVFVVDRSGGRAVRRAIRTGRRNPEAVEVLEGLKAGERVITSAYDGLEKHKTLIIRGGKKS